jgi:hypothetical protein
MATMKRCLAQLSLSGSWGSEHFWPGLDVDLDRELAPAVRATAAKGREGTEGYVPPRAGVPAFTVADAVVGRENCFEDVEPPAPADGAAPKEVVTTVVAPEVDLSGGRITLMTRAGEKE